jgi:aminoglycoside 6'-N-acetyltransferase I
MGVRPMRPSDRQTVLMMRLLLWPDDDGQDDQGESVLVWEQDGLPGGFISYSLRSWADGCLERPVPYIEGWFVREDLRLRGIGRALVAAVEEWARAAGFNELGSDVAVGNRASLAAHRRLGFEPTDRLQLFRKDLRLKEDQMAIAIEVFRGSRSELLPLFAQADDSPIEIDSYIELGEVFVARRAQRIIGHVQLISAGSDWEIKSLAVIEMEQGRGVGAALVRAGLDRALSAGACLGFWSRLQLQISTISVFTNGSDSGWIASNEMHSTSIVAIPFSRSMTSQFEIRCGSPSMSATLGLSDDQSWVKPRGTTVIALLITSQPEDVLAHSDFHW